MKKAKKIIGIITVVCVLLSMPTTAFARTLYEQVKYLDDQEIFDGMWDCILDNSGTENEEATGNTFVLSYYRQDLKNFLNSYKIPDGDFKLINLRDAYFEKIENSDTAIEPYSKKVFDYISAHPDFELSWSFDTSEKEYTCYDKSELIDSFYSDTFVEYSKTNVKNKSFWTYDESNDTYVNKTESGKVVKSIPKYHLEDSNSSSSSKQSSSGKTESNNERSQNRNKSDVGESAVEIDEDSSRIVSGADNSNDNLSGSNSELEKATATVPLSTDDFAVLEAPQEENSSNQADVAILISIGGLILAGIGVIIYLLIKNKKNKKSGDTNEKDKEDLQ